MIIIFKVGFWMSLEKVVGSIVWGSLVALGLKFSPKTFIFYCL